MYNLSQWAFSEEVSQIFDQHVRQSVPLYGAIQDAVVHLSDFFIQQDGIVYDLGCATGETIQKLALRHKDKNLNFIGIDNSSAMLQKAQEKNSFLDSITWVNDSLERYSFKQPSNFIVSILTLQFIPVDKRAMIIQKIYDTLQKGGALLLVEKTYSLNSRVQDMFTQIYHDYKEEQGLTPEDIRNKDKSLRGVMIPISIQANLDLVSKVGFEVEVFYKYLNFTGFLCVK